MPLAEAVLLGEVINTGRMMAHECRPPPGYVEQFQLNVKVLPDRVIIKPRSEPMTADRIRQIEREWRERTRKAASGN